MSVVTKNPFALLDEDGSTPATPVPDPASGAQAQAQPTRGGAQRGARGTRGGPASRGGKYYARGGPKTSGPREGAGDEETVGAETKKFDGEGRGRGGRGGRGRSDRGGRGGNRRGYDRHSATGKTDSEKKVHQSWGGDDGNAELRTEEAAQKDAGADLNTAVVEDNAWGGAAPVDNAWGAAAPADDAWGAPAPAADDAWGAPVPAADAPAAPEGRRGRDREPEEPDNTLTLDQYLAQQKDKTFTAVPKLEARKIESDELWKDAVALQRRDEDEDAYFVGKQTKSAPKARAPKPEKIFLEIDVRFERPNRGGRGRGGERGGDRGGDRGGRARVPRGRARANGPPTNLDVGDEKAFPSLA